jgi:hypothetical protein
MPLYSSIKTKTNGGSGLYSEVLKRKKQEAEKEAASIADATKSRIESIAQQRLIHANRVATETPAAATVPAKTSAAKTFDIAKFESGAQEAMKAASKKQPYYGLGNVDLNNLPIVTKDVSRKSFVADAKTPYLTTNSMIVKDPNSDKFVLILGTNGDRELTTNEAIDQYLKTGKYLGKFKTIEEADKYSQTKVNAEGQTQGEIYDKQYAQTKTKPWYKQTGVDLLKSAVKGTKEIQAMTPEERAEDTAAYRTKLGGQPAAYYGSRAEEGLMSYNQGLLNAAATAAKFTPLGYSSEAIEALKEPQNRFEREAQAGQEVNEPVSEAQKTTGDVLSSVTRMVPSVLASLINPILGKASFGVPAVGSYAREAELEGASDAEQMKYGLLGGAVETAIESLAFIGPLKKILPTGLLSKVVKNGTANMSKNLLRIGLGAGKAALGEAAEEAVTNPIMGIASKLIYDKDKPWVGKNGVIDFKQMGYDALIGGITGGLFAAPNVPFNIAEANATKQFIDQNYDATLAVAQGLPKTYKSSQTAAEYTKNQYPISYNGLVELQEQTAKDLKDYAKKVKDDTESAETETAETEAAPITEEAPIKDALETEAEEEFQKEITTPRPEAETEALAEELRNLKPIPKEEQPKTGTGRTTEPTQPEGLEQDIADFKKGNISITELNKKYGGGISHQIRKRITNGTPIVWEEVVRDAESAQRERQERVRYQQSDEGKKEAEDIERRKADKNKEDRLRVFNENDGQNIENGIYYDEDLEVWYDVRKSPDGEMVILQNGENPIGGVHNGNPDSSAILLAMDIKNGKAVKTDTVPTRTTTTATPTQPMETETGAEQIQTPSPAKAAQEEAKKATTPKTEPSVAAEQKDYPGMPKTTTAEIEAIEEEFFGKESHLLKINLQLFATKFKSAQDKLRESFKREKDAIRWTAKEKQSAALDRLSQKYDTKIDKLNKLLDAEKYKNFWKNELDKKELRDRVDKLRTDKNEQITDMKKKFSEKLKKTKKEYMLKKTEAISKLKEKARDKAVADRAKAAERAEINKKFAQLREIGTKRLKYMRPEYKKKIEAILSMFDITAKSHTSRKLAELQKLKQYIEDNPEHNIPERLLNQLNILSKKTASQITKEEFDNIYNAIMHLTHLEQLKDQLIINGRHREAAEIATEASENVLEGRKIRVDPTVIDTNKPEFSKNFVKEFFQNHLNPETLSIMSDQRGKGIIKKILFDDMYEGHSNEVRYKQDAYKIFEDFLDGLGNDIRSWSRSFNKDLKSKDLVEIPISKQPKQSITKIRITKAERLYLYLASQDADAKRSMLSGGVSFGTNLSQVVKLTEADLKTIADSMSNEEKQFATLADKYFADFARPRMNEVFLDLNGYELIPKRKGYVPIKRHQDFLDKDYLKMRNKSTSVSLEGMGVLKERVKSSTPIVADDIFRVLVEHIEKISAYTGLAKPLRNAKMLMENTKLKNAYRQVGMYSAHMQLNKYIQDVETKSVDLEFIDKLGYSIQNKFASSALGLNPFTILKQFSAYALETNEIPAKYLLKAQFTKTATDEIKKYSPILAERAAGNISLELGDIGRVARIRRLFGNYKDIPQLLTKGIVAADRQIIGKTWNAVKMMLKEENPQLSEDDLLEKTARKTEEIVRHTNSASTMYDRSSIARSRSLFTRAATMFTSQTNIMFNSTVQATLEYNQSEKTAKDFGRAAKKLVTILVIANIMEQSIDQLRNKIKGKDDDDEKNRWNIPLDIVEGILNQVYFVGKIFSAYRSKTKYGKFMGYDVSVSQLQVLNQMIDYATDITTMVEQVATKERYKSGENKGKLKWKKTLNGLTDDTFSILSRILGLPYDSVKSLVESFKNKID